METYTITFISFLIYFFLKQKAQQVGDVQKLKSMTINLPITIHNNLSNTPQQHCSNVENNT
jgi:hypothetical protein